VQIKKRVALTGVLLTLTTIGGCTTQITGTAIPGNSASVSDPITRTAKPKDRDLQAVTVALRKIDACALFDLSLVPRDKAPKAAAIATGPHSCILKPDPGDPSSDGE
jgi:hypothetical protein